MTMNSGGEPTAAQQPTASEQLTLLKREFPRRLKQAIGSRSIHSFAKSCGMSDSLIRKYLSGSLPGLDKALIMAKEGGVSLEWLTGGELSPFGTESAIGPSFDLDLMEAVIATTRQNFLERNIKLPPEEEAKVIRLIYELKSGSQEPDKMRKSIKINDSEFPINDELITDDLRTES